ncbi:MAG: SMP-30/gluconolactonase/LRE family protein [Planctomycetes bacterium]|nr:SMP-30/gluconolactonase/LRE family protein [Planctomycetota bacterium]
MLAAGLTAGLLAVVATIRVSAAAESSASPAAGVQVIDAAFNAVADETAEVRPIASDLKFTEGPTWHKADGCLLFSDIPANRIYRWTEGGGLKVWREPSNNSNGNTTDTEGRLVTCEHGSRRVTRTAKDGTVEVLCDSYKGKRLNSPNDVAVKNDGTIWFTDPPYGIKPAEVEQDTNYVFRLDPGAKEPVVVASDFARPNGICFSPDQKVLYVADSDRDKHHVRRFEVQDDNTLTGGKVFCTIEPGVPDGIRCDTDGRLYVSAGDGVQVFLPAVRTSGGGFMKDGRHVTLIEHEGRLIGKIRTPLSAANCAFGGADGKTLFITARTGVWAVELKVAGTCR